MKRTVTAIEMQQIFQFLEQKRLRHFDLQVEMADHFASAIEAQWGEDPSFPFQTALEAEFSKFGITGFSKVVQKRQRAAEIKKLKDINGQMIKRWVATPLVVVSILLLLLMVQVLSMPNHAFLAIQTIFVGTFLCLLFALIRLWRFCKRIKQKLFLLETQFNLGNSLMVLSMVIPFNAEFLGFNDSTVPYWGLLVLAFATVGHLLMTYEYIFTNIPRAEEEALNLLISNEFATT